MATTDRPDAEPATADSDAAAAVGEADLVQLVAVADGDCLAAAGLLAVAGDALGIPYHVGVVRTRAQLDARLRSTDESTTTLVLGAPAEGAITIDPAGSVARQAHSVAAETGGAPDAVTALAGVVSAGGIPSRVAPDLLDAAHLDRAPGVAVPTADVADGLAHTGLAHAAFSGDPAAARAALTEIGLAKADGIDLAETDGKRVASLFAIATAGASDATPRAATAVERALRPYRTDRPFVTLGGYADVLDALAECMPGLAVALSLKDGYRTAALEAWREHGRAAHAAVRDARTARYPGVLVARTEGPVAAVARLLRDYRSPEPVVLAVGSGEAAIASLEAAVERPLADAAAAAGGSSLARGTRGYATMDPDRTETFVETFREAR